MTEPSGQGDYAEAMRELISELRLGALFARAPEGALRRGLVADNVVEAHPVQQPPARGQRGHLRLVR